MITKIQFQRGASVLTADGAQVGTLERVVVDPGTNALTDIVVRTGGLLKRDEKVVPIGLIAETTEDQVLLREEAGDLESLPPFEQERLVDARGSRNRSGSTAGQPPVIVGYPVLGTPLVHVPGGDQSISRLAQNIPEGTVALKEGAKVVTAEGKHVGNVERVLADPSAEEVTHLLVSKGRLAKEAVLIPMKWVMILGEEKVHLRVKKDTVEKLAAAPLAG